MMKRGCNKARDRFDRTEEGAVLKIGNEKGVHFEMNLSDDVMLKSYKINIHNNFDHHGHDSRQPDRKT